MIEKHRSSMARSVALLVPMLLLCLMSPATRAQNELARPPIKEWQKTLDEAEKDLAQAEITDSRLESLRGQLMDLRTLAQAAAAAAAQQAEVLRSDLAALGPPPAQGAPPEAPTLAARRKSLNDAQAAAEGAQKEAELLIARADRVIDTIKVLRRTRFTERIFSRSASPLAPSVWRKGLPELASGGKAAYEGIRGWLSREITDEQSRILGGRLVLGLILAIVLTFPLRAQLIRRFGYVAVIGEPTYLQRLWTAAFTGVVHSLLPSIAASAIYFGLLYDDVFPEPMIEVARTALLALVGVFFVSGFCHSALAPYDADWRLAPIHDCAARAVSRAITWLAVLFALDRVLMELGSQYVASVELITIQKFVFGLSISAVLLTLLRRRVWFADGQTELGPGWQRLRFFLAVLVGAIPLSAILGYVVLSRLLATQLVLTAGLYVVVILLCRVAAEAIAHLLSEGSAVGRRLRVGLALSHDGAEMLAFWLSGALQLLILLLGILVFLVLWGAGGKDLSAWLQSVFFGFRIGNVDISLSKILWALLLFAVFLTVTRMLQKSLDQRIFPRTRLDLGVRNSIIAAIGYVGFIIAAMLAISTLGIDLSNLAIIAGALSVGIGFGLQNIVNNFVSGLILLVERPIKVGDWVVVGDQQGYVKKISVRATEITTFDRASLFIPNSTLISGMVVNRTYAEKPVGQVVLPVRVAYAADLKKARELLLNAALAHREIRRNPPPLVSVLGFGDFAINLELAAVLNDPNKVKEVTSDLCFAIQEAFTKEGIEIPLPQRKLNVTLDEAQLRRLSDSLSGMPARTEVHSELWRGSSAR